MSITERRVIARIFVDCFSVGDIGTSGHAAPSAIDIRFILNNINKNGYVGNDVEVVEAQTLESCVEFSDDTSREIQRLS